MTVGMSDDIYDDTSVTLVMLNLKFLMFAVTLDVMNVIKIVISQCDYI